MPRAGRRAVHEQQVRVDLGDGPAPGPVVAAPRVPQRAQPRRQRVRDREVPAGVERRGELKGTVPLYVRRDMAAGRRGHTRRASKRRIQQRADTQSKEGLSLFRFGGGEPARERASGTSRKSASGPRPHFSPSRRTVRRTRPAGGIPPPRGRGRSTLRWRTPAGLGGGQSRACRPTSRSSCSATPAAAASCSSRATSVADHDRPARDLRRRAAVGRRGLAPARRAGPHRRRLGRLRRRPLPQRDVRQRRARARPAPAARRRRDHGGRDR